jgi:hypothetical protein
MYFYLIANGRHRKKKIFQLEQDEGKIVGEANLRTFITEYFFFWSIGPKQFIFHGGDK